MSKSAVKTKASRKPSQPEDKVEFFHDVVQNSAEWLELRRGVITASQFKVVLRDSDSETKGDLLYKLAGELLSGQVDEGFKSEAMRRGHEMELAARDHYAASHFCDVKSVGFVRRTIASQFGAPPLVVGCSPDSQIGPRRGLEIKTMKPSLLIRQIEKGTPPIEHRAQIHGTMWVCGWDEMVLKTFYRGMPVSPEYKFERDDNFIREIREAVESFDYDLKELVKKIGRMGGAR